MASSSAFIIRCKYENGSFILKEVNSESTVQELKMYVSQETKLDPESITILCGYPPKALTDYSDVSKLRDVNILSGETIIVEKKKNLAPSKSKASSSTSAKRDRNKVETAAHSGNGSHGTSATGDAVINPASSGHYANPVQIDYIDDFMRPAGFQHGTYEQFTGGIMMRHVVPSNNSCLFTSVYFVLSNGDMNPEKSADLRKVIARVVASNPDKYTQVFLGMDNKDYCAWIQNPDRWGGGIELAILSEHFGIEIVAVDVVGLTMHRFGESSRFSNRIFLIYDGIHYDPLILEMDNAPMQTIFPVSDDRPMEMALEIAKEAKSSRQYTDVANFTLQCNECHEKLRGDKEAREHAAATGHVRFGEVTN